jgi:hypothetical protein
MKRRNFIRNTLISLAVLAVSCKGRTASLLNQKADKKITVGAHVWVYAATQPEYDVSPILSQIFSDVAYAGVDAVETMEQPLRSTVYTKQIKELIDQFGVRLLGSSYGADFWNKDKQNEIYEDVDLIFSNMASVGGRTFGVTVGEPDGREKTEEEFDNQAALVDLIFLDEVISVDDGDSIIMAQNLAACLGLGVGISSGANFLGAVKIHELLGPDSVVVTVFSDDNKKYLSTDLLNKVQFETDFISSKIELKSYTSIGRVCRMCCDPVI